MANGRTNNEHKWPWLGEVLIAGLSATIFTVAFISGSYSALEAAALFGTIYGGLQFLISFMKERNGQAVNIGERLTRMVVGFITLLPSITILSMELSKTPASDPGASTTAMTEMSASAASTLNIALFAVLAVAALVVLVYCLTKEKHIDEVSTNLAFNDVDKMENGNNNQVDKKPSTMHLRDAKNIEMKNLASHGVSENVNEQKQTVYRGVS